MSRKPKNGSGGRQRTESFNWPGSSYEEQEHNTSDTRSVDLMFPVANSTSVKDPYESLTHSSVGYERIKKQRHSIQDEDDMDPNYEKIHRKSSSHAEDIGYAQIHQHNTFDNGYERIHKSNTTEDPEATYDMGYERIHHSRSQVEDTYERIHRDERDDADVGYEQIHKTNNSDQDSNYDVRYEKIHRKNVSADVIDDEDNDPNYEELKTSGRSTIVNDDDDPNYEVLSTVVRRTNNQSNNKESAQHNYASINKFNKRKYRQSEPNFASINNNESTYECMNDCQANSTDGPNKDTTSHKRSSSVSRIEVEPNVFYSQVQKLKRLS